MALQKRFNSRASYMSSGYFILPNLSRLSIGQGNAISELEDTSRQLKDVEPVNYEFPEKGVKIRQVDWNRVRATIKTDVRNRRGDAAGYPSYRLTFSKDNGDVAVNLHMTISGIKMLNSEKVANCFRIGLPETSSKDKIMYMSDLFHDAAWSNYKCDMSPDYGQSSEGVDLLLNSVATIASNLGCIIKLQDASKFNMKTATIPVILPVSDQVMTKTLRLKRGYGYYDARGFMSSSVDYAILKEMAISDADMPDIPDKFVKAFQINLDWIHLWVTTPLNDLNDAVFSFIKKVLDDKSLPTTMKNLFATAKERFEEGPMRSIPYMLEDLDKIDDTLKTKSMRELVYKMAEPNEIYEKRLYQRQPKNSPDRYDVLMTDAASFMDRVTNLEVDSNKIELQSPRFTQRTFKMPNESGTPSVFRMGVSVPSGDDDRPIVQLVELNSDINVLGSRKVIPR